MCKDVSVNTIYEIQILLVKRVEKSHESWKKTFKKSKQLSKTLLNNDFVWEFCAAKWVVIQTSKF